MNFKPMLAGKAPPVNEIRFPVLASPKLDGIRFHVLNGVLVSRNLLPFKNAELQKKFGKLLYHGFDGELMCGDPTDPMAFRKAPVANSFSGDISEVVLHVFDDFTTPSIRFDNRLHSVIERTQRLWKDGILPVEHFVIENADQLAVYESRCLELGYEGVMLRDPAGPYKYGRSTTREGWLLKVKQFCDSEAVIDDVEELMHNANEKTLVSGGKAKRNTKAEGLVGMNKLGAFVVRDIHTGVSFSVGTGFTDEERRDLWDGANLNIGRVIKYKYFPTGSKDKPRFPVFLGFRDPIDI